jgi:hypothetical protein
MMRTAAFSSALIFGGFRRLLRFFGASVLCSLASGLSGKRRNTNERSTWHTRHMAFRIDYYKEGELAGSTPHPGPQHETEQFAKDGMMRRRADFYRIIDVDSNAEVASGHRDG